MYGDGPLSGFRVRASSIVKIRWAASAVRQTLGIEQHCIDVEALLEQMPDWGLTCAIRDEDFFPPGIEACFDPDTLTIYLSEETYQGVRNGNARARFTAMHELGHFFLSHKRTFNRESSTPPKVYEDSEWQANQFAAEILMPLALIRLLKLTTPDELMEAFGVSFEAAVKRLKQLGTRNEL